MKIKFGRKEINITNEDVILDNGACFQLMTQNGVRTAPPQLAKAIAKQMIKDGQLKLTEEKGSFLYYKFNVDVV